MLRFPLKCFNKRGVFKAQRNISHEVFLQKHFFQRKFIIDVRLGSSNASDYGQTQKLPSKDVLKICKILIYTHKIKARCRPGIMFIFSKVLDKLIRA